MKTSTKALIGIGVAGGLLLIYEGMMKKALVGAVNAVGTQPGGGGQPASAGPTGPVPTPQPGQTSAAPSGTTVTPGQLSFRNVPSTQPFGVQPTQERRSTLTRL